MAAAAFNEETLSLPCVVCQNTPSDPMLLNCLHHACRKCFDVITTTTPIGTVSLKCPDCLEVFDMSLHPPKHNLFISAMVSSSSERQGDLQCQVCQKRDHPDVHAEYHCVQCKSFLCGRCLGDHEIFLLEHQVVQLDQCSDSSLPSPAVNRAYCDEHKNHFTFYCHSCCGVKCVKCLATCEKDLHNFTLIDVCLKDTKDKVNAALMKANESLPLFRSIQDIQIALENLRQNSVKIMQTNKKSLLDLVSKVYTESEAVVDEHIDSLSAKCTVAMYAANQLGRKMKYSYNYCQKLLDSTDVVSLVDQQNILVSRLQRLSDETHTLPTLLENKKRLLIEVQLPLEMEELIKKFVGLPHVITGSMSQLSDIQIEPDLCRQQGQRLNIDVFQSSLLAWLDKWQNAKVTAYEDKMGEQRQPLQDDS